MAAKILILTLCLSLPLTGQASYVQDATAAARAGDHARALELFERARSAGDTSPRLTFNLAVTHYHLGNSGDADRLFRELLQEPRWHDLAAYNLGLVALQRGDAADARSWFRLVADRASDDALRGLAAAQLRDTVGIEPLATAAGLVSVAVGFDSNVIAFPDQLQADSSAGADTFVDLLGYGQMPLGERTRGYVFGYTRRHQDLDFMDPAAVGAGVTYELPLRDWRLEVGGTAGHSRVGGDAVTSDVGLLLRARRAAGAGAEFVATLRPAFHAAGSAYPELEGTMHRAELAWRQTDGPMRLTLAYRAEFNDREDFATDTEFFSHSPVRHRVLAEAAWRPLDIVAVRIGGSHEVSDFRGVNRMTDVDDVFREASRRSNRTDLWLRGEYRVATRLSATGELRHTRNDDTFTFYEYDRSTIAFGLEYAFR